MSIDGAKPLLALSFMLDSPLLMSHHSCHVSAVPLQRSSRPAADKVVRHERRDTRLHACDAQPQGVATDVGHDSHPDGALRIERMPAF